MKNFFINWSIKNIESLKVNDYVNIIGRDFNPEEKYLELRLNYLNKKSVKFTENKYSIMSDIKRLVYERWSEISRGYRFSSAVQIRLVKSLTVYLLYSRILSKVLNIPADVESVNREIFSHVYVNPHINLRTFTGYIIYNYFVKHGIENEEYIYPENIKALEETALSFSKKLFKETYDLIERAYLEEPKPTTYTLGETTSYGYYTERHISRISIGGFNIVNVLRNLVNLEPNFNIIYKKDLLDLHGISIFNALKTTLDLYGVLFIKLQTKGISTEDLLSIFFKYYFYQMLQYYDNINIRCIISIIELFDNLLKGKVNVNTDMNVRLGACYGRTNVGIAGLQISLPNINIFGKKTIGEEIVPLEFLVVVFYLMNLLHVDRKIVKKAMKDLDNLPTLPRKKVPLRRIIDAFYRIR